MSEDIRVVMMGHELRFSEPWVIKGKPSALRGEHEAIKHLTSQAYHLVICPCIIFFQHPLVLTWVLKAVFTAYRLTIYSPLRKLSRIQDQPSLQWIHLVRLYVGLTCTSKLWNISFNFVLWKYKQMSWNNYWSFLVKVFYSLKAHL